MVMANLTTVPVPTPHLQLPQSPMITMVTAYLITDQARTQHQHQHLFLTIMMAMENLTTVPVPTIMMLLSTRVMMLTVKTTQATTTLKK